MGRGGEGSGGSHGGGGGHFNYGSSRGGGRSSSNYNPVYRTSYYTPMTPLGGTLSIVLAIIVIVAGLIAARPNIQQSTIERSKLDSSLCTKVDTWYQDDINWIHDEKTLLKGLKTFYDKTGVQPYLWITDNINGKAKPNTSDFETALKSKYSELFKAEAMASLDQPIPDAGDDVLNKYANGGGGATSAKLAELKARLGK